MSERRPEEQRERDEEPQVRVVDRRWWARDRSEADSAPEPAEGWTPGKPTYVAELEQKLAEKDRELREVVEKYRLGAREFEEARARLRREVQKEIERGRRTLLVELLEVVDNLDRALEAGRAPGTTNPLLDGVELVRQQFLAKLEGFGIQRLDPRGQPFDPSRHEAISTVPTRSREADGTVVGVVSPGYVIGDDILRPALVAVAKLATEEVNEPDA